MTSGGARGRFAALVALCCVTAAGSALAEDVSDAAAPPASGEAAASEATGPAAVLQMPDRQVIGKTLPRVVILGMEQQFPLEGWTAVERRATDELRALGFDVVSVQGRASTTDTRIAELGAQASQQRAVAALRIVRHGGRRAVHLWLYDALTGKMVLRRTQIVPEGGADADAVGALRVVELLHASLLELRLIHARSGSAPALPRPVRQLLARKPAPPELQRDTPGTPALLIWGGPSLLYGTGGLAPAAALTLAGAWLPRPELIVGLDAHLALTSPQTSDSRGAASLSTMRFGGHLLVAPWPEQRFSPAAGLAVGALLARASGTATPPNLEHTVWTAALVTALQLRLSVALTRRLALLVQAGLGASWPRLTVRFDDDAVARLGPLLVDGALALAWSFGS